jgi:hypothetical protein
MRIRAIAVFEGIIYNALLIDPTDPSRPRLEVDAILRPGDADADAGPLLLSVAEFMVMIGDATRARAAVRELESRGRVVERMGVRYVSFPTWEPVAEVSPPGGDNAG